MRCTAQDMKFQSAFGGAICASKTDAMVAFFADLDSLSPPAPIIQNFCQKFDPDGLLVQRNRENSATTKTEKVAVVGQDTGEKSQQESEKKQDTGEKKQDTGEKKQDTGEKKQDTGEKKQDTGEKKQDTGAQNNDSTEKQKALATLHAELKQKPYLDRADLAIIFDGNTDPKSPEFQKAAIILLADIRRECNKTGDYADLRDLAQRFYALNLISKTMLEFVNDDLAKLESALKSVKPAAKPETPQALNEATRTTLAQNGGYKEIGGKFYEFDKSGVQGEISVDAKTGAATKRLTGKSDYAREIPLPPPAVDAAKLAADLQQIDDRLKIVKNIKDYLDSMNRDLQTAQTTLDALNAPPINEGGGSITDLNKVWEQQEVIQKLTTTIQKYSDALRMDSEGKSGAEQDLQTQRAALVQQQQALAAQPA